MASIGLHAAAAFYDELEKIAASTTDLLSRLRVARNVDLNSITAMQGGGGVTFPKMDVARELIGRREAPLREGYNKVKSIVNRIPSRRVRGAVTGKLEEGADAYRQFRAAQTGAARDMAGHIGVHPDLAHMNFSGGRAPTGPAEVGANTAVVGMHELYERGVKKKNVAPLYSHIAPEVLLREHNLLSRLSGPGAAEVKDSFRKTRNLTGEAPHMRQLVLDVYGPRAERFFQDGEKIPSAMIRNLRKKIRKDPDLIRRAQANVPKEGLLGFRAGVRRQMELAQRAQSTSRRMQSLALGKPSDSE